MQNQDKANGPEAYDVVVCGGGLAGLCFARQLKMRSPERSIVVLEKVARPLPEACHKVGESSVELAAYYFTEVLGLHDYFKEHHIKKLGLRWFYGTPKGPQAELHRRPELGLAKFPNLLSIQIDRGILESDLRDMVEEAGVDLREGVNVVNIELAPGDAPHSVTYNDASGVQRTLQCRWVIDCTGRRRMLQKKLGLTREVGEKHSAVWWRVEGRVNIADMVPKDDAAWHARVPNDIRWHSTNHLHGHGYWVWIIPLSSGRTSIGIVTNEERQPWEGYNTYERAKKWLQENEPQFAEFIADKEPLDFLKMRGYTHGSFQCFGIPDQETPRMPYSRWACIGEAGVFADPYLSSGSDLIAVASTISCELIQMDFAGRLRRADASFWNWFFLNFFDIVCRSVQGHYRCFDNPMVGASRLLWSFYSGAGLSFNLMFHVLYRQGALSEPMTEEMFTRLAERFGRHNRLTDAVGELFDEWARLSPNRSTFDFIPYLEIPTLSAVWEAAQQPKGTTEELLSHLDQAFMTAEDAAQAFFRLAVEDVIPERLHELPAWVNPYALTLDPARWEKTGVFKPANPGRNIDTLYRELRALFRINEQRSVAGMESQAMAALEA